MADKAISELTQATEITDSDLFVLQQGDTAKKLSGSTLKGYVVLDVVSAEAQTLPAGSEATANYNKADKTLQIGIPTGATGATGPQGKDGAGSMYFRGTTLVIKSGALPPSGDYDTYSGNYNVKVPFGGDDAVLETENKLMRDNLTVEAVNVSETTNTAGGKTMIIGE